MRIVDLTSAAFQWLDAVEPSAAFMTWLGHQDSEVRAGFAALRFYEASEQERTGWIRRVAAHRDLLRPLVDGARWRRELHLGTERALIALDQTGPEVRLYSIVGIGNADASAVPWRGSGAAFIWLESWLGPGTTGGDLQDRPLDLLGPSVAHEVAHAIRYAMPGSSSPLARSQASDPIEVWRERVHLPLRETMYDEGLATAFSCDAFPEVKVAGALGVTGEAAAWLDRHWRRLVADRLRKWRFDEPGPPLEWLQDALFFDRARARPPWTIERPPAKWGYYVGLQWAMSTRGDWMTRLASRAPQVSL